MSIRLRHGDDLRTYKRRHVPNRSEAKQKERPMQKSVKVVYHVYSVKQLSKKNRENNSAARAVPAD